MIIAVGKMVHEALRRWKFPPDITLDRHLEAFALGEGLVEHGQRARAVAESKELLRRCWENERRKEIEEAVERYHELPFSRPLPSGNPAIGVIDLLFRDDNGWTIVDFKTDELGDEEALRAIVEKEHYQQLLGYKSAVESLLGVTPRLLLCYLDYQDGIRWEVLET